MGSSVKRKWSFFLLWALNPRSQWTIPIGMMRVHKFEKLDYPRGEGLWCEASQFPRLDAWIICHSVIGSITPWRKHNHLPWKSVTILWTIWIIVPKIIVTHHSGNHATQSKLAAYGIYESNAKTNLRRSRSRNFVRFPRQTARISFE